MLLTSMLFALISTYSGHILHYSFSSQVIKSLFSATHFRSVLLLKIWFILPFFRPVTHTVCLPRRMLQKYIIISANLTLSIQLMSFVVISFFCRASVKHKSVYCILSE